MKLRHLPVRRPDLRGRRLLHRLRRRHPPDCLPRFGTVQSRLKHLPSVELVETERLLRRLHERLFGNQSDDLRARHLHTTSRRFPLHRRKHDMERRLFMVRHIHRYLHELLAFQLYADRFDVREPAA